MMSNEEQRKKLGEDLTKSLADDGRIVEAGWVGYLIACKLKGAPEDQLKEMRQSFYAGAMHLMSSMMSFMDPGAEPTQHDMDRMSRLVAELHGFQKELEATVKNKNNNEQ